MIKSIPKKRLIQMFHSLPHYYWEVKTSPFKNRYTTWLSYKFPGRCRNQSFPLMVNLEITNHCNFKCSHCFRSVMKRKLGYMNLALISKLVAELSKLPNCGLKIVGLGEPSLHPAINEIFQMIKPVASRTIIYTNGTLFRNTDLETLLDSPLYCIVVSIDGTTPHTFAKHREGGDYDFLRDCLIQISKRKNSKRPYIEIRHLIHPGENHNAIARFVKSWKKYVDIIKFNYIIPVHKEEQLKAKQFKKCRDIYREMYIRWDGRVPLCGYIHLYEKEIWLGNFIENSLLELWHHERLTNLRLAQNNSDYENISYCKYCEGC